MAVCLSFTLSWGSHCRDCSHSPFTIDTIFFKSLSGPQVTPRAQGRIPSFKDVHEPIEAGLQHEITASQHELGMI